MPWRMIQLSQTLWLKRTTSIYPWASPSAIRLLCSLTILDIKARRFRWATDEASLNLKSNPQLKNTELPLVANGSIDGPNRSRLRRSRRSKRGQKEDTWCKSPYPGTTTTTTPEAQQGAPLPSKQQEWRPWPKLKDTTGKTELWLQLYTARRVEGESNLKVCNRHGLSPVCYPYKLSAIPPLVSPALIVQPCRFCKWDSLSLLC